MAFKLTIEGNRSIPVQLSETEFNEFILKHLPEKMQKRHYQVSRHKIFNYILKFLYMGCQWKMLPIEKDKTGRPEIHYSQVLALRERTCNQPPLWFYLFNVGTSRGG